MNTGTDLHISKVSYIPVNMEDSIHPVSLNIYRTKNLSGTKVVQKDETSGLCSVHVHFKPYTFR
jgi:hypothetical protein